MVVYYATILHARKLKVAALLDSDSAGDEAAKQAVLLQTLGNKAIIRTKDAYTGPLMRVEMEDLLRHTLVGIAKAEFAWDIAAAAAEQPQSSNSRDFQGRNSPLFQIQAGKGLCAMDPRPCGERSLDYRAGSMDDVDRKDQCKLR